MTKNNIPGHSDRRAVVLRRRERLSTKVSLIEPLVLGPNRDDQIRPPAAARHGQPLGTACHQFFLEHLSFLGSSSSLRSNTIPFAICSRSVHALSTIIRARSRTFALIRAFSDPSPLHLPSHISLEAISSSTRVSGREKLPPALRGTSVHRARPAPTSCALVHGFFITKRPVIAAFYTLSIFEFDHFQP